MKEPIITKTEIFKLDVPLKESFTISLGTISEARNVAVTVHTDTDMAGTGECSSLVCAMGETQVSEFELAKDLAALIKGKNPLAVEQRLAEMDRAAVHNNAVKSAFDMALYDLLAQKAGLPLYRYLGGSRSREIHTDLTVGLDTPEHMAAKAREYKKAGIPFLKVKVGTSTEEDVSRIRAVREEVGGEVPLRIDANQGWDAVTAVKTLRALEIFDIEYCEEPVPHWDNRGLARVSRDSPIPIMADESLRDHRDAFRLACMGACDYFNIKLGKSGGIHNALKIIAVAEAAGMKCQVGCMSETRLGLTALTHLATARSNIVYFDIDSCFLQVEDPVLGGIEYKGRGQWVLPETPGIGARFDPAYLDRMEKAVV